MPPLSTHIMYNGIKKPTCLWSSNSDLDLHGTKQVMHIKTSKPILEISQSEIHFDWLHQHTFSKKRGDKKKLFSENQGKNTKSLKWRPQLNI